MRRLAVYIGTTAGPVAIERITREPAARTSMVCLGRSARQLALSDDYDSFTAPGIGAAARAFGPFPDGGFRMDLSAPVAGGDSWQLAAFVAHAACADAEVELAVSAADADTVVWLTGSVDYDYAVGAVEHVAEKLHASSDAFAEWLALGRPVVVMLPEGESDTASNAGLPDALTWHAVHSAAEACRILNLRLPDDHAAPPPDPAASGASRPHVAWGVRRRKLGLVLALLGIAAIAAATWMQLRDQPSMDTWRRHLTHLWSRPAVEPDANGGLRPAAAPTAHAPLRLSSSWRRAPAGHTCRAVQFGETAPQSSAQPGRLSGLCGFSLELEVDADRSHVAADLIVLRGRLVAPDEEDERWRAAGPWRWSYDLPKRLPRGLAFQVLAVAGVAPVDAAWKRLLAADDTETEAEALRRSGLAVLVHRVDLQH